MLQLAMWSDAACPPDGDTRLSQWMTPPRLAARLVKWAGINKTHRCLEPSCGTGAFVGAMLERGAKVVANDVDPRMSGYVEAAHGRNRGLQAVWNADFLEGDFGNAGFDWVTLNPPYEHGQDREHLAHACAAAPRVLALIRSTLLHGVDARRKIWKKTTVKKVGLLVGRPRFLLGGTVQDGPKHDYCAVVIDQYHRRYEPTLEWLT
jgi:predicted RNA methylase